MPTWRDNVSAAAQDDLDALTDQVVQLGANLLAEHGEFLPFALCIDHSGQVQVISPNYVTGQDVGPRDAIAANLNGLRDIKGTIRACALGIDVRLPETDEEAIDVVVEHSEGIAIGVSFPYTLTTDSLTVGEPIARSEAQQIW